MPDGATHIAFNTKNIPIIAVLGFPLSLVGLWFTNASTTTVSLLVGVSCYVGYLVGYILVSRYIDPDADQLSLTSSEGRLMRDLGVFGFIMVWWMFPYAYIMKWFGGHRGLSHVHLAGTITRVLWVGWLPCLVWWWFYFPLYKSVWPVMLGVFLGLCVADSMHIHLDNHPPNQRR